MLGKIFANKNQAAQRQAAYQQMLQDQKFLNSSALFYSKGAQFKKGNDAAVVGYSRDVSDATAAALDFAGKARLSKAIGYAAHQQADSRLGGKDALNQSRTAGRNQFLAMAQKNHQLEYAVDQTFGLGMQNAQRAAGRVLQSNRDKLLAARGVAPLQGPRIPMPKRSTDWAGGFSKLLKIGAVVAAPFTGGASLKLLGIPGLGDQANLGAGVAGGTTG